MTKKDINYIKFIKPAVKERAVSDKENSLKKRSEKFLQLSELNAKYDQHNTRCEEAAKMSCKERLVNYFATGYGEYIGSGCKWDLLTQLGRDRRGRLR